MTYIVEAISLILATYALFLIIQRLFIYTSLLQHAVIALHVFTFISAITLLLNNVLQSIYIC